MTAQGPEPTVVHTQELPPRQRWVFHTDLNVLALSSALDDDGRQQAIDEARGRHPQITVTAAGGTAI